MQSLIEQIHSAFSNTQYPGDDNLTNSFGEEAEALVIEFRQKTDWKTLKPEFLNPAPDGWCSALSFFSAEALLFYLPAYLIADINGELDTTDPVNRLCVFVAPQMENKKIAKFFGGGTLGEHARKEFKQFDHAQVSAIVGYLLWRLEKDGYNPTLEQGLENYWLQRESELAKEDQ